MGAVRATAVPHRQERRAKFSAHFSSLAARPSPGQPLGWDISLSNWSRGGADLTIAPMLNWSSFASSCVTGLKPGRFRARVERAGPLGGAPAWQREHDINATIERALPSAHRKRPVWASPTAQDALAVIYGRAVRTRYRPPATGRRHQRITKALVWTPYDS